MDIEPSTTFRISTHFYIKQIVLIFTDSITQWNHIFYQKSPFLTQNWVSQAKLLRAQYLYLLIITQSTYVSNLVLSDKSAQFSAMPPDYNEEWILNLKDAGDKNSSITIWLNIGTKSLHRFPIIRQKERMPLGTSKEMSLILQVPYLQSLNYSSLHNAHVQNDGNREVKYTHSWWVSL